MQSMALTSPSLPAAGPVTGRRLQRVRATAVSDEPKLNKYSARITEPKSQGASQAVLYGVGLTDADLRKPQVGVSSVWYEGNTCNMHLLRLAEAVRDGVREAGMVGFRFNTVGVSDAISMGTRGMCYSLQSRDLIADSIETVMGAQHYDANISIPGCDKNVSSFSAISAVCRCDGLGVLKCLHTVQWDCGSGVLSQSAHHSPE
jgi:dihydroxy-acid dehydratase